LQENEQRPWKLPTPVPLTQTCCERVCGGVAETAPPSASPTQAFQLVMPLVQLLDIAGPLEICAIWLPPRASVMTTLPAPLNGTLPW
jgi:hypothetical protein